MHLSSILVSTLAVATQAAPAPWFNFKDLANPSTALDELSQYFNLVSSKVQSSRFLNMPPVCDLSKAQMPTPPEGLGAPAPGLAVHHVAVGRGTQNYTCDAGNANAAPEAAGAVATLFNANCIASMYPDILQRIPGMAVHFALGAAERLGPVVMAPSGKHYFRDAKTPFFDLGEIGQVPCAANNSANAPSSASVGQKGEAAVKWLRLLSKEGVTENIKEIWRVDTAGGSPPASCKNMPAKFQIQYSAVYWFWAGNADEQE